ncbi:hypothetical protein [Pseudoalteromonas peptidolytica]|uniref:Uncharacterized protein n=1 Tax=Pseudoalteromonas peptidolytica F12-50-A1 TaxID=1315280 RepID=A0A8I0MYR5_9GAMM|nr:hypothetical protein [Pseudoalteromonas peptidolytica]MBE0347711.1 hypothetical protein [Pseudoalteromonas peptidolytica F12-50-A1]NLR16114.1 hypothetical protein [Pseudoalteromonas peptidolytica]
MKHINIYFLICFLYILPASAAVPNSTTMQQWLIQPKALNGWQLVQSGEQFHLMPKQSGEQHGELYYAPQRLPCVVSVPHRFHDKHTLVIGQSLFESTCQLLLANTKHRYDRDDTQQSMDYAKQHNNLHSAAIVAFMLASKDAKIFQIHGFSKKKRKTDAGRSSDIILSQGKQNNAALWNLKTCLAKEGYRVMVYPQEVKELGGTKNILHQLDLPKYSFIHIELSYQIRKQLTKNNQQLEQFNSCVRSLI